MASEPATALTEAKEWIELAKLAQASFHNRRAMEWKLAFGFWTAIGTFTAAFFTKEGMGNSVALANEVWWAYISLFALVVVCWQIPLHSAHAGDKVYFNFYMDRAWGRSETIPPQRFKWSWNPLNLLRELFRHWRMTNVLWCVGQSAFSGLFLWMSYSLIKHLAERTAGG